MARFKKCTEKSLDAVAARFLALLVKGGSGERAAWALWLDTQLDNLLGEDAFGTEGQLDPRGDHRD